MRTMICLAATLLLTSLAHADDKDFVKELRTIYSQSNVGAAWDRGEAQARSDVVTKSDGVKRDLKALAALGMRQTYKAYMLPTPRITPKFIGPPMPPKKEELNGYTYGFYKAMAERFGLDFHYSNSCPAYPEDDLNGECVWVSW